MFDDNQNPVAAGVPPTNLPTEPADMFDGVKDVPPEAVAPAEKQPDALAAGRLQPKASTMPSSMPDTARATVDYKIKEPVLGKIFLALLAIILIVLLGYGAYWAYGNFFADNSAANIDNLGLPVTSNSELEETNNIPAMAVTSTATTTPQEENLASTTPTSTDLSEVSGAMANDEILFGEPVDTDNDGLDDIRERELGTSETKIDSDGDGLNDGDEVLIFKTDPLNPDTDGDGYLDGGEVRAGYNPLGPGKLFNTPTSTVATSTK